MLTLRSGEASLVLAPEIGGSIVGWRLGRHTLLRQADTTSVALGDVRGMGCFPLVPYANRIENGCFDWEGRAYTLARNFGDHPHSIHGVGWQRAWTVAHVGSAEALLTFSHQPRHGGDWPFAFAAEQLVHVAADGLSIALRARNLAPGPAPMGLGLHPFFPRPAGAILRFRAGAVWLTDATALARSRVSVPADWDHSGGLAVGAAPLDNCFDGWDGKAELGLGPVGLTIEASSLFTHLQVFTPSGQEFFCVEPVTHHPNAINDPVGGGMHVVAPGEVLEGSITFRFRAG